MTEQDQAAASKPGPEVQPTPPRCGSYDGDTGLACLRELGHEQPHRCEIEWGDDD